MKKYTLITGGSSGIGRSIALSLSKSRNLIIHGRDVERLENVKKEVDNSDNHLVWSFDLNNINDLSDSLITLINEKNIEIEAFVHSAGNVKVFPMRLAVLSEVQNMFNVNFFSAAEIIHLLLKKKINNKSLSNVVFISSIFSKFGAKGHNIYCATKGAVDSLMKSLAVELAPNVRVNSILPGGVKTKMSEESLKNSDLLNKLENDYPLGLGLPEYIADAVDFLLSEKSGWITGQQIIVDGGRTANMSQK